ncbi:Nn.00g014660.m01.CDS01 [Neocucurbitaria sp. VM-36]
MASESLMNCAGRTSSHSFADLRSASYAHRRTKKFHKNARAYRRCFDWDCALCHHIKYRARRWRGEEIKHHIQNKDWEEQWSAGWAHEEDLYYMDEIVAYQRHGKNADIFEGRVGTREDGWLISGENFGAWGRRRIMEMRAVKEERIRKAQRTLTPAVPTPVKGDEKPSIDKADSTPRIPHTTLPITPSDIEGHQLLSSILTPNKYFRQRCRVKNIPPIPAINGFYWFGEYAWQFHRNGSGCWELGYVGQCDDCGSFPCPCCCTGNGSMYYGCSCKDFARDEKSPEEVQSCSLVEWVRGALWDVLVREEFEKRTAEGIGWEGEKESDNEEWELMSHATSEGWSVVSEESEYDMLDV